ncbi:methylenetetrahydrofolate reductase [Nonomuraea sp. B5E05]|uniref:methylenetetrahydrofolate reductase n=1 Tax=Nonomuraea sp. B5E05 TaxID=3153569 RepID=UPI003261ACEA
MGLGRIKSETSGQRTGLLRGFSLEMTGKDVQALEEAADLLPPGTRVNVTYLGNEDFTTRVNAARVVRERGLTPVPHLSARRLRSKQELEEFLAALGEAGATEEVCVVGGDLGEPAGPYEDSLAVIRSGLLPEYGVRQVSVAGYPEGHPHIAPHLLWRLLEEKHRALRQQEIGMTVITQFGFDSGLVVDWVGEARDHGIGSPVRVGVPGPAGVKRLLRYARRFGVKSSAGIAQKYGFSLTNLLGTAGPDRFILSLGERLDPVGHGEVLLHFYTFGGLRATAQWVRDNESAVAS